MLLHAFFCVARGLSPVFCSQDPLLLLLLFDFFSHALFRAAGYWYRRPTFIFIRISRDEIFNAFSQPHHFTLNKMLQEAIKPNEFKFLKKLYSVINDFKTEDKTRSSCLQRMWNRGTSSKWCCWAKSTLFFLSTPRCTFSVCCVFTAWIEKHFYLRCTPKSHRT